MAHDAYHWLVANGLWRYVIGWLVGFTLGHVSGYLGRQKRILDALRTDTPGGLADVVDAVKQGHHRDR